MQNSPYPCGAPSRKSSAEFNNELLPGRVPRAVRRPPQTRSDARKARADPKDMANVRGTCAQERGRHRVRTGAADSVSSKSSVACICHMVAVREVS